MTKKILAALVAVTLVISMCSFFTVSAEEEIAYWVEAGATGKGTEDDPFGTLEEAIEAIGKNDGTVYIYGVYNISAFKAPKWSGMITIAGVNSDSLIQIDKSKGIVFGGDVTIKDILFEVGEFAHINPAANGKLIYDAGEDSSFKHMIHLPFLGNGVAEESYAEFKSGTISRLHVAGSYATSYANGVSGDSTTVIDGATVNQLSLQADAYMDTHTGISIGGNLNIIVNSGKVKKISTLEQRAPEIMGSLNFIFNNGTEVPADMQYTEDLVSGGVYIIASAKGGMIMPTPDLGVFEVKSDSQTKVAKIDGNLVYNGTVELEPGEYNVEWVDGEQPAQEEKIEIKLTIGKAEITTNGTAKALDVPAQIIESRTMVPLRAIFEALGASVEWDDATKTVTSVKGDTTVKLTIGDTNLYVNGEAKTLDVPAQIVDSRTLVPVRAIAESFGCEVGWDDPTKTVTITK